MLSFSKYSFIALILFFIGDSIWFKVAGGFFKSQIGEIARLEDGAFAPRIPAAVAVYILLAISVEYFVYTISAKPPTGGLSPWSDTGFYLLWNI